MGGRRKLSETKNANIEQQVQTCMNKKRLKQLMSPSAWAATIATGMLAISVAQAALGDYSVSAVLWPNYPTCKYGLTPCGINNNGIIYYWCCDRNWNDTCGPFDGSYGWCFHNYPGTQPPP